MGLRPPKQTVAIHRTAAPQIKFPLRPLTYEQSKALWNFACGPLFKLKILTKEQTYEILQLTD